MTAKRSSNSSEGAETKGQSHSPARPKEHARPPSLAHDEPPGVARVTSQTPQEWLRNGLQKLYDDTVRAPIPESIMRLLDELDRNDRDKK